MSTKDPERVEEPPARAGVPGLQARLASLRDTGLLGTADPALDRFAGMVRKIIGVPLVLISLVDDSRQYFPGASGLGEPLLSIRQTPMTQAFCQAVIRTGRPLILDDARTDPRFAANPAVAELGVVGYAGLPLNDEAGHVLGSLCAVDHEPRAWLPEDLDVLSDLAASCSAELRVRISARRAERSRQEALAALAAQRQAQADVERLSADVNEALDRSRLLLAASETLTNTTTVDDVVDAVADLVSGGLAPAYVGVVLLDETRTRLDLVSTRPLPPGPTEHWVTMPLNSLEPAAVAVRQRRTLYYPDRDSLAADFPARAADMAQFGWHALICAPLIGTNGALGTLRFAWDQPHPANVGERAVVHVLAGYVAQALERARHLSERISIAETLQRAMLTDLPSGTGYQLAARYEPAHSGEEVGGDWYDAIPLPGERLALVIGDVVGHDMVAAARMGQLRSMLRAYLVDRSESPSAALRRLDASNFSLNERTMATLIVATLQPAAGGGAQLAWSSAGHPAPVVIEPDGTVETLSARGLMLGARWDIPRQTHTRHLPSGSTLLLHTDGLIETRVDSLEVGEARLRAFLADRGGWALEPLLETAVRELAGPAHEDDIALLAVRLP